MGKETLTIRHSIRIPTGSSHPSGMPRPPHLAPQPPTAQPGPHYLLRSDSNFALLANLYLHWFDKVFRRANGPAHWAKAKLVRYADDFVVLARSVSPKLRGFIETKLETWMGLEINRDKTRVLDLKQKGASLDFLGFSVLQKCTDKEVNMA